MKDLNITVYGATWCSDCRRTKKYLGEHRIHYLWKNIENDTEAYDYVISANEKITGKPKRKIPVVVVKENGKEDIFIEPSNVELADRMGLAQHAEKSYYHTIIIGGGPAGLTAALYLARDGYDVLVVERSTIGGQAFVTNRLDNFPGFPEGIEGDKFASNLRLQVEKFGVEFCTPEAVVDVRPCHSKGNYEMCTYKIVETNTGEVYTCSAVIVATGSMYREITMEGASELLGVSVHYCATCDGAFYKDKEIFIVGGGNSAYEETLWLVDTFVKKATIIIRGESKADLALQDKVEEYIAKGKIEILKNTEIKELVGESKLEKVVLKDLKTEKETEFQPDGIFVFIGLTPNTKFMRGKIKMDPLGFIETNLGFQTSEKGIYCAGDCRYGSQKQAVIASGEGASAALSIKEYLKSN